MFKAFKNFYHHKYHLKFRHAKKLFIFDLCLLAVAAALLGLTIYFLVWRPSSTDKIDLSLSFGPFTLFFMEFSASEIIRKHRLGTEVILFWHSFLAFGQIKIKVSDLN